MFYFAFIFVAYRNAIKLMWIIFIISAHVCTAFLLKCPEPAQWALRAKSHCLDPSKYFCLQNDLIRGYSENCTRSDFQQPGRRAVLRGGIDAEVCSAERFQPFPIRFYTNVSTNCIFFKSFCNEDGQVVYDPGNRNTDTTCRCDYRRGYTFVVSPENSCFCKPLQEDCSCYLKTCLNTSILSPDYLCLYKTDFNQVTHCRPFSDENYTIRKRPDIVGNVSEEDNISFLEPRNKHLELYVIFIFGGAIMVLLLVLFVRGLRKYCFRSRLEVLNASDRKKDSIPVECHHCEKIYRCNECNKVLCNECFIKHDKPDLTFRSTNDKLQLNENFKVSTWIVDMKVVSGEIVVIALYNMRILETHMYHDGRWHRTEIKVGGIPCNIAVMDMDTVVILLTHTYEKIAGIQKVDIKREQVYTPELVNTMSPVDFYEWHCPFSYIIDQLYFGVNSGIKVTNMSGEFDRKIDLEITPRDICYDAEASLIYCFDSSEEKLISIEQKDEKSNTFTNFSLSCPKRVTIDGDGNILILCKEEPNCFKVNRISQDGKSSEIIITLKQHKSYYYKFASICFHKGKDAIIVGLNSNVYFYNSKCEQLKPVLGPYDFDMKNCIN
ncbi:uncharacterized protein [Mytilus edulis]|uniref:uncharacterized protein n=1 Tax=Mytilus edulis TaxID=6550 RepID=UPI0039EF3959